MLTCNASCPVPEPQLLTLLLAQAALPLKGSLQYKLFRSEYSSPSFRGEQSQPTEQELKHSCVGDTHVQTKTLQTGGSAKV